MDDITVDVWSDLVCPWCYIGKRNFENALAGFSGRESVTVRWHSFELDPHNSREPRETLIERHQRDVGGTDEQVAQRMGMLTALAEKAGLTYRLNLARAVNTFDAHRLMHYADGLGKGEPVRERLMRAYTEEGAVVSDFDTLVRLGVECGLDAEATREVLEGGDFADDVHADEALARRVGVTGVPTFVFNGQFGVSGAQSPQTFAELLEKAAGDS